MHLTALVDSPEHVCCRYRLAAFQPYLERAGHAVKYVPMPRGWWRRFWYLRSNRYETTILQRRLLSQPELHVLRRNTGHLIFDFDDAVWLRDSHASKGLESVRRAARFAATVAAADSVFAGNTFLAEMARRFTDPRRVHVVPTCVDPAAYPKAEHTRQGEGVRIVWIGSASTLRSLELFRGFLEEIGLCLPGLRLKLVCDQFLSFKNLPVDQYRWQQSTEAIEVATSDIGIAWMPDDDWSRGKCGLKVLQYMAAGLPVVANPVGVHNEMIREGETGYLATTASKWVAVLRSLVRNPDLRRRLGEAGRRRVEDRYGVATGASQWLRVLAGPRGRRAAA